MPEKPFLTIGVIGLGIIGETYIKFLYENPYVRNILIASSSQEKINSFQRKYQADIFNDLTDMIERGHPHAICICTPNYNHSELARFILKNKKKISIFVEKPIAINKKQLEELMEAAQNMENRTILVGHSLHFATPYKMAKQLIESGEIGQTIYIEGRYKWFKNYLDWRSVKDLAGGGFLT